MTKKIITITKYHFADYYVHRFTVGLGVYSLHTHTQTHTHIHASVAGILLTAQYHGIQTRKKGIPSQVSLTGKLAIFALRVLARTEAPCAENGVPAALPCTKTLSQLSLPCTEDGVLAQLQRRRERSLRSLSSSLSLF